MRRALWYGLIEQLHHHHHISGQCCCYGERKTYHCSVSWPSASCLGRLTQSFSALGDDMGRKKSCSLIEQSKDWSSFFISPPAPGAICKQGWRVWGGGDLIGKPQINLLPRVHFFSNFAPSGFPKFHEDLRRTKFCSVD